MDGRESANEAADGAREILSFLFICQGVAGRRPLYPTGTTCAQPAKKTSVLAPQSRRKRPAIMARLRKTPKPTKEFARYIDFLKK
jgi:hypothetical protein